MRIINFRTESNDDAYVCFSADEFIGASTESSDDNHWLHIYMCNSRTLSFEYRTKHAAHVAYLALLARVSKKPTEFTYPAPLSSQCPKCRRDIDEAIANGCDQYPCGVARLSS